MLFLSMWSLHYWHQNSLLCWFLSGAQNSPLPRPNESESWGVGLKRQHLKQASKVSLIYNKAWGGTTEWFLGPETVKRFNSSGFSSAREQCFLKYDWINKSCWKLILVFLMYFLIYWFNHRWPYSTVLKHQSRWTFLIQFCYRMFGLYSRHFSWVSRPMVCIIRLFGFRSLR